MLVKGQAKENPETMSVDGNEPTHSGNEYGSSSAKLKIDQPGDLVPAIGLQNSKALYPSCLHSNVYCPLLTTIKLQDRGRCPTEEEWVKRGKT